FRPASAVITVSTARGQGCGVGTGTFRPLASRRRMDFLLYPDNAADRIAARLDNAICIKEHSTVQAKRGSAHADATRSADDSYAAGVARCCLGDRTDPGANAEHRGNHAVGAFGARQ